MSDTMQHVWTLSEGDHIAGRWENADTSTFCRWFLSMKHSVLMVKVGERSLHKRVELKPEKVDIEKLKKDFPGIVKGLAFGLQLDTEE